MLLLERDPLVLSDQSREGSLSDRLAASNSQGGLCAPAVPAGELRPSGLPPHVPRRATLLLWVMVVALAHFDRGVVMAAAMDVASEDKAHLSFGHVVALLVWHSAGLALGGVIAGAAFQQVSAKALLLLSMLVNAVSLLVLSLQVETRLVLTAVLRCISGIAASFPLLYLPLWVDEFSGAEASGQWMAIVQTGVPVGQTLGMVVTSAAKAFMETNAGSDHWRLALLIQAILLVPVVLRVLVVPAAQVDVANIAPPRTRLDSLTLFPAEGSQGYFQNFVREMREMVQGVSRNPLNSSLTSTLCLLQYTSVALALWTAPYLALSAGAPSPLATLFVAALLLVLVPTAGTYAGALICNRMDGFKAGHHAVALRVACVFITLASLTGPISGSTESFVARLCLIAFWLFCAGAFLPISSGVLMTSMPSYLRSFSTASLTLMYQVISYSIAQAVVTGLMSWFIRPVEALRFGMSVALWATAPAAGLLVLAYAREPKGVVAGGLSGVDDLTFSDISYELSRRRMSTSPL